MLLIPEKDLNDIHEQIKSLDALVKSYKDMYDPTIMEATKRELIIRLTRFSTKYAELKGYKSGSHVYMEDYRKQLKAECLKEMEESHSKALDLVYAYPKYVEGVKLIEGWRQFFLKVEARYDMYNRFLDALIQSTSISQREKTISSKI